MTCIHVNARFGYTDSPVPDIIEDKKSPVKVMDNVIAAAGSSFWLALLENETVWAWGDNKLGSDWKRHRKRQPCMGGEPFPIQIFDKPAPPSKTLRVVFTVDAATYTKNDEILLTSITIIISFTRYYSQAFGIGFVVHRIMWDAKFKGIDDYLLNCRNNQILSN